MLIPAASGISNRRPRVPWGSVRTAVSLIWPTRRAQLKKASSITGGGLSLEQ
jgi:hypothetical protein